uniref:Uncharacterized protein n=1 Tax=Anopheles arabiensis TaxID=7173 RepID=A0A182IHW2_ANOAR
MPLLEKSRRLFALSFESIKKLFA